MSNASFECRKLLSVNLNAIVENADVAIVELALCTLCLLLLKELISDKRACCKKSNSTDNDTDNNAPIYILLLFHLFILLQKY